LSKVIEKPDQLDSSFFSFGETGMLGPQNMPRSLSSMTTESSPSPVSTRSEGASNNNSGVATTQPTLLSSSHSTTTGRLPHNSNSYAFPSSHQSSINTSQTEQERVNDAIYALVKKFLGVRGPISGTTLELSQTGPSIEANERKVKEIFQYCMRILGR